MTVWMSSAHRGRLREKLLEFALTTSGAAELSEIFAAAIAVLEELFGASRVTVWTSCPSGTALRWCAGSTTESSGMKLELAHYSRLAALLGSSRAEWVDLVAEPWPDTPGPLLGTRSFIYLPLCFQGKPKGCVLVLFDEPGDAPPVKELELGELVASLLAGAWQGHELRRCEQRREEEWLRVLRLAQSLVRAPGDRRALEALVQATGELLAADGLAIYQSQGTHWQRLVAYGVEALMPSQLPGGPPESWPWEQATATSATLVVPPAAASEVSAEPWRELFPGDSLQTHELLFLPLPGAKSSSRVALVAVPSGAARSVGLIVEVWSAFLGMVLAAGELPAAATQAEVRSLQIFDCLPLPAFQLDAGGSLLLVNRALLEWTGASARLLLEQPLARFLDDSTREGFLAWLGSEKPSWRQELAWSTSLGPKRGQLILQRLDEGKQTVCLGFVIDLGVVERLDQEREQLAACLKAVLESVAEGVWVIGADRAVEFVNHRLAHLLGADVREIGVGRSHTSLVEQLKGQFQDGERVAAHWHYLNTHWEEVAWDELELLQPRRRLLERFVRPVHDAAQHLLGRLEIYRDLTQQRQLEQKIIQRERLASLGQLVSGVAHELNNPLTAIAGYAQLLLRHDLPLPARPELNRLAQEAERASRIVKNLLTFARPAKPERQPVSIEEVLERALEFRAYELTVGNVQVERRYAPKLPTLWANSYQLQQVFLNLLLNAEQAIRITQDSGTIRIRTARLSAPDRIRVEVSDTGPGISAEDLPHVFEPFFSTKNAGEGTGLGLSISRTIVKDHGGEIHAANRPGGGALFAVELPVAPATEQARPRPAVTPRALRKARPNILVVDDETSVAQLVADVLTQQGYTVQVHTDSREALQDARQHDYDLVICDIKMPGLDGEAFHEELRAQGHPLATRILFTTGDTLGRKTDEFLHRVSLPCLAKPFLVEELKTTVADLLQAGPARVGLARS